MRNMKHSLWLFAYLVLALPILHFFIFYVYVNFDGVALAFKDVSTGALTFGNFRYVFKELVSGGSEMFTAIKNTFAFWMLGWILMPINILVSFLLYKKLPGYKFFQVVCVLFAQHHRRGGLDDGVQKFYHAFGAAMQSSGLARGF